jgi:excinuclease ABC subunit B
VHDILEMLPKEEAKKHQAEEAARIKNFAQKASDTELMEFIGQLENEMDLAARNLEFERAAELRDQIELLRRGE